MSLFNIKNNNILYRILLLIPVEKRIGIINGSKKLYKKLEYFYITKNLYSKLFLYINNIIKSYYRKIPEHSINIISFDSMKTLSEVIQNKFPYKSKHFLELIEEIIFESLKLNKIFKIYSFDYDFNFNGHISNWFYEYEDDDDDDDNKIENTYEYDNIKNNYEELSKYNFYDNIIVFSNDFCQFLKNESTKIMKNINKINGIVIKIKGFKIKNLELLYKYFNNINYLELDFSDFYTDFNDDTKFEQIFNYLNIFAKNNPIEILYFIDNTERKISFVENYKNFVKQLNNLNEFYFYKHFENGETKRLIQNAYENEEDFLDDLEDPNLILDNYLSNINNDIKVLNIDVDNPCCINGNPGDGSFFCLATPNESFDVILKFSNLKIFVLSYEWPAEYYFGFGSKNLSYVLNSINSLETVVFKYYEYLKNTIPLLKIKNTMFI